MTDNGEKVSKKELTKLLEKEILFLEIVRQLHGWVQTVPERPESLEKLAVELKEYEAQIVKHYFFPVDRTIDTFTSKPSIARDELIQSNKEGKEKLLLFIDRFDKEVNAKVAGGDFKRLQEGTKKIREMLLNL